MPSGKASQPVGVDEKSVEIAVAVVIEQRDAGAENFDDIILHTVAAAVEHIGEAGFGGDVGEGNAPGGRDKRCYHEGENKKTKARVVNGEAPWHLAAA